MMSNISKKGSAHTGNYAAPGPSELTSLPSASKDSEHAQPVYDAPKEFPKLSPVQTKCKNKIAPTQTKGPSGPEESGMVLLDKGKELSLTRPGFGDAFIVKDFIQSLDAFPDKPITVDDACFCLTYVDFVCDHDLRANNTLEPDAFSDFTDKALRGYMEKSLYEERIFKRQTRKRHRLTIARYTI